MLKEEILIDSLRKIEQAIDRIIKNSACIDSYHYYYNTPSGMERLESTCMLLIAMGIRDIIAHHYFDLDGEIVYSVVKTKLPDMLITIRGILKEIKY